MGNEVQKKATSEKARVTRVRMKDGGVRQFEQAAPAWKAGQVIRVGDNGQPMLLK